MVSRVAAGLEVLCGAAGEAILAEGRRVLIGDPARFYGIAVIGVDEHA